jgi:hypothetical protein
MVVHGNLINEKIIIIVCNEIYQLLGSINIFIFNICMYMAYIINIII